MTTAIVIIARRDSEGADADPVVSRAVATASAGPFLVSAMGFATLLMAAGLADPSQRSLARWTGIVAVVGAVSFLITFPPSSRASAKTASSALASSPASSHSSSGRSARASLDTAP